MLGDRHARLDEIGFGWRATPAEALGGRCRLDLVADFGDRTIRLPVSDTATAA